MVVALFRKRYKLRGKAVQNASRQYGRVKEIKDLDKMLSYTCKDDNVRYNVKDRKWLEDCMDASYKKNTKDTIWKEYLGKMDEWIQEGVSEFDEHFKMDRNTLSAKAIRLYMEVYDRPPTRQTIMKVIMRYDINGIDWYMRKIGCWTAPSGS